MTKTLRQKPHLLAIGSVMIDTVIDARELETRQSDAREDRFQIPVHRTVGGVALNMATYAQQAGFEVTVIARIGGMPDRNRLVPDRKGQQILRYLESNDINPIVSLDPNLPTGEVILLYVSDTVRKSIPIEGANSHLGPNDSPKKKINRLEEIDVLFIDGHILIQSQGHALVRHLKQLAQSLSCLSVLDLVPHTLYKRLSFTDLAKITAGIDVLQANFQTLRRFLSSPYTNRLTHEEFDWNLDQLSPLHKWLIVEDKDVIFVGGMDLPSQRLNVDRDFKDLRAQRGFGAHVAANWLYQHFFGE